MHLVSNGEKCKMHKIDWCEGGLQLADIETKIFGEHDLTPRMKYIFLSSLGLASGVPKLTHYGVV